MSKRRQWSGFRAFALAVAAFFLASGIIGVLGLGVGEFWMFRYHVWLIHLPEIVQWLFSFGEIAVGIALLRPARLFAGAVAGCVLMLVALVSVLAGTGGERSGALIPLAVLVLCAIAARRGRV